MEEAASWRSRLYLLAALPPALLLVVGGAFILFGPLDLWSRRNDLSWASWMLCMVIAFGWIGGAGVMSLATIAGVLSARVNGFLKKAI